MLLRDYYPKFLRDSKTLSELWKTSQIEHDRIDEAINDLTNQLFVKTATWGLDLWESFLNIKTENKPVEFRRAVILSKLRGSGTTTIQAIKDLSLSFQNGEVDVIEYPLEGYFTVKFIGLNGVPPNLQDFLNAIEDLKPAHLGYTFEFSYMTWNQFDGYNKTWDAWDALNLNWDEFQAFEG